MSCQNGEILTDFDIANIASCLDVSEDELWRAVRDIERERPEHLEMFLGMIDSGETVRMAAMLATQTAPRTRFTDATFQAEKRRLMNPESYTMRKYLELAKKAGINTHGKYYVGGLGKPTDPAAWVSSVDDVKAVCRRKNLNADGLVSHTAVPEPPPRVQLADDIVDRHTQEILRHEPETRRQLRERPESTRKLLRERVLASYGRSS